MLKFVVNPEAMTHSKASRVFITGATGFIGSHVARYFCREGVSVTCGVRRTADLSYLKTLPVDISYIDLRDTASLARGMEGADFVIHTAGLVNDWSKYPEFYTINVTGTRNLMQACAERGIDNVIMTGSSASYGEEHSMEIKDEGSPDKPRYFYFLEKWIPNRLNYYRTTKHLASLEAIAVAREKGMNLTVIEPVWVYGEREFSSGFYEYMKVVRSGIPFFPGSRRNHFHVIYAGELARAYYAVYEKRPEGIHRMLVGNSHIDTMDSIYTCFCREMGRRKPQNLPWAVVYPLGLFLELMAELFRTKNPPLLSRCRVNMMYDNIGYSTKKAEDLIAFRADMPIEKGIAQTVKWYKENNLI